MATITTSIGPIGARQINQNFYVGMSDLTTIQKAVTAAAVIGNGCVIIPAGYAGIDTIASVTGGTPGVYISDQRTPQTQNYVWNLTSYIPADFVQQKGYVTTGIPAVPQGSVVLGFDPAGTSGAGTAALYIAANPGMGMPSLNIAGLPSDGTPALTFFRCEVSLSGQVPMAGIPQVEMPSQLGLFNEGFNHYNLWTGGFYTPGGKGMTVWARPTEDAIDLQGQTIGGDYDQTIRLNLLGGNVEIGPITFDAAGNIIGIDALAVSSIDAEDAIFQTCEVDNSPVRTFANTPDSGGPGSGMIWPDTGIPVSLGDQWQDPSIDPASLATWPAAGVPVSTGAAWGTPINPATLARYPFAGVAVSTGTAWDTPINPAMLARYPAAGIPVSTGTAWGTSIASASLATWPAAGVAVSTGTAWGVPINPATIPSWPPAGIAVSSGSSWTTPINPTLLSPLQPNGYINTAGSITSNGPNGALFAGDMASQVPDATVLFARLTFGVNGQAGFSNTGEFHWYTSTTSADSNSQRITLRHQASDYGWSGNIFTIDRLGNMFCSGNFLSGGQKNFVSPHPSDNTKNLTHSTLEGPECGVYYRGEGATAEGWAEIILPDYFEALTMKENRSVLLTPLFDDEAELISMLAASRIKDGKFKVWSALPKQKFFWEVIAVRSNVEPLVVITDKELSNDTTPPARINRSGKAKA